MRAEGIPTTITMFSSRQILLTHLLNSQNYLAKAKFKSFRIQALMLVLSFLVSDIISSPVSPTSSNSTNAYVSILYTGTPRDYEFFLATRVLLQSLVRLKVDADLVVIASNNVPHDWVKIFIHEGVKVISVANLPNPYTKQHHFNQRFVYTLNKLYAWRLVEYERVVMLDADNLFLQKADELFLCGQFCASFIDPCIFHTGLFVLEPSIEVFNDMNQRLATGTAVGDGYDQGFLTSYFADLLDKPLFHVQNNGSRLNGHYRLPFGYQMDASYYYLRLKWRVPCGVNSVVTFPGAPWLKPWYWWSWPVLPLGLLWHNQRNLTIGYGAEFPVILFLSVSYTIILMIAITWRCLPPSDRKPIIRLCIPQNPWMDNGFLLDFFAAKILAPACIVGCFVIALVVVPTTTYPVTGWAVFLLGSLSLLVVVINVFRLPVIPAITPWILSFGCLLVMASPFYANGIIRGLSLVAYAAIAMPFLCWSLMVVAMTGNKEVNTESGKAGSSSSILMKLC